MAEVKADYFDLEAMVKQNSSWHPCKVSFSSSCGLTLNFGSDYPEDVLFTEEEALACIRFRSNPLQGEDCLHLKEGDRVIATPNSQSKNLFFDAKVEKVHRVRHSKRTNCRCTFEIKWLCPIFKGENVIIPSSSIMKVAINKIDSHPTVAAFLNSVKSLNFSGRSPFTSLGDADLATFLDRQIEEIIKLADSPTKGCVETNFFELNKVNFVGQERQGRIIISEASFLNDKAPHLSPLGARAALASIMHDLPRKQELSVLHVEQALPGVCPHKPEKHATSTFLGVRTFLNFDSCIKEKVSMQNDILEGTCHIPVNSERTETTQSLISGRSGFKKSSQIKGSLEAQLEKQNPTSMLDDPDDERLKSVNVKTRSTTLATDKKLNHPTTVTRLTRSAMQKGTRNSNNDVELESLIEDSKSSSHSHTTRLSRSALQNKGPPHSSVEKGTRNSNNDVELKCPTEDTKLSPLTNSTRLTRSALKKGVKLILIPQEGNEESSPAEGTRSVSKGGDHISPVARETRSKKSSSSIENLSGAQEKNKKQKLSAVAPRTRRRGEDSGNEEDSQAEENTSSKNKLELRSSPRLRLPRAHCQK